MSTTKFIVAVDPGVSGGIAVWHEGVVYANSMPDGVDAIRDTALQLAEIGSRANPMGSGVWYQEKMLKTTGHRRPESTTAVYAYNAGCCAGSAIVSGFHLIEVWPQEWQQAVGAGTHKGRSQDEWKNHLKEMAEKLYPKLKPTRATADALLLLHYAVMKETGVAVRAY